MENASKALIIAGAVLLAVLVLSLMIYMVSSGGDFLLSSTGNEQNEAKTFNSRFLKYESSNDKKTSGEDVKQLLKDVNAINKDEDDTNNITLTGLTTSNEIRNNREYNVTLSYSEETGKVNSINISLSE